ncbi:MAG: hypothetical protein ACHQ7M_02290 [Chloroflexota bacterium]
MAGLNSCDGVPALIVRLWMPLLEGAIDWQLSSVDSLPALYDAIAEGELGDVIVREIFWRGGAI